MKMNLRSNAMLFAGFLANLFNLTVCRPQQGQQLITNFDTSITTTAVPIPPLFSTMSPVTSCTADVVFLLEVSERLSYFAEIGLQFIANMTTELNAHNGSYQSAILHYSDVNNTQILLDFNETNENANFTDVLRSFRVDEHVGVSDLASALSFTHTFLNESQFRRPNVSQVLVLMSSGYFDQAYNCCDPPYTAAMRLQRMMTIYSVAIGPKIYAGTLATISLGYENVYNLGNAVYILDRLIWDKTANCTGAELIYPISPINDTITDILLF